MKISTGWVTVDGEDMPSFNGLDDQCRVTAIVTPDHVGVECSPVITRRLAHQLSTWMADHTRIEES